VVYVCIYAYMYESIHVYIIRGGGERGGEQGWGVEPCVLRRG